MMRGLSSLTVNSVHSKAKLSTCLTTPPRASAHGCNDAMIICDCCVIVMGAWSGISFSKSFSPPIQQLYSQVVQRLSSPFHLHGLESKDGLVDCLLRFQTGVPRSEE